MSARCGTPKKRARQKRLGRQVDCLQRKLELMDIVHFGSSFRELFLYILARPSCQFS
jgi:hypothetical protein